jgi:hypothetical protein
MRSCGISLLSTNCMILETSPARSDLSALMVSSVSAVMRWMKTSGASSAATAKPAKGDSPAKAMAVSQWRRFKFGNVFKVFMIQL